MTGSACHRKGSTFEREVVKYLQGEGVEANRLYGAGRQDDRGDVGGFRGVVLECKNRARMELGEWTDEAEVERVNDSADYGIVVHKRRGKGAAHAYATLPLWQLTQLLKEAGR